MLKQLGWRFLLGILCLMVMGAVLRRYHLAVSGLWYDELAEVTVAARNLGQLFADVRLHAAAAPLDYLAVKGMTALFGHTTVAARLWSVAVGIAAIPVAGLLARSVFDDLGAGFGAAFLVATSPFLVAYSQEARFYSAAVLMSLLLLLAFSHACKRPRMSTWAVFAVAACLGLYTYYFTTIIVIACVVATMGAAAIGRWRGAETAVWRARVLGVLLGSALAVLGVAPWLVYALPHQAAVTYPYPGPGPFSPPAVASVVTDVLAPITAGQDAWWRLAITGCILGLSLLGIAVSPSRPVAAWALALVPVILIPAVWIADSRSSYFLAARQLILIAPVLYVLAGRGASLLIAQIGTRRRSVGRIVAVAAVASWCALCYFPLERNYANAATSKPGWESAASYVAARVCPDTTVYVNLGSGLDFGVGYYQAELMSRSRGLLIDESHPAPAAVGSLSLKHDDFVVLWLTYWVTRQGSLTPITQQLEAAGLTPIDYSQIRVFAPAHRCSQPGS